MSADGDQRNPCACEGGRSRVMIVEDEFIIALALRRQVEALGCEVCCVTDSAETSLAEASRLTPDAVLMDVSIRGGSDGIEAARRLTGELGLPVIIVSAYTDEETMHRAREAGAVAVLGKPASDEDLRRTLARVLGRGNGG